MSEPILTFKAGRVDYNEETKQATPKRGQGLIKVLKNPDDPMLFSFVWEPRGSHKTTGGPESRDELLLFPGDAQWVHLKQCTSGRVFALRFRSSGQNFVFWMQSPVEPGQDINSLTDEDNKIINELHRLLDEESLADEEEVDESELRGGENASDNTTSAAPASSNEDIELPDADQPSEEGTH